MNLERMMENLRDMKADVNALSNRVMNLASDSKTDMADLKKAQDELAAARARYDALQGEIDHMKDDQKAPGAAKPVEGKKAEKNLNDLLKSNEYNRAFAKAMQVGAMPGRPNTFGDELNPVYDALTIAGGETPGEDGGFLVPEDLNFQIMEAMRSFDSLADLVTVENVSTSTGWRIMDAAPEKGFTKQEEELAELAQDDQPIFGRVPFTVDTYGLIIPVSNQLFQDEISNLYAYLGRWFGKKLVLTQNQLVTGQLGKLEATDLTAGSLVKGLKSALNKGLDPAISRSAVIVTNQDGFDALDQEEDGNKRPLLQPDVADGTQYKALGRRIHVVSNSMLPSEGGKAPLYIGNMKQFMSLFRRMPLELRSTDIGGNAFRTYSTEVRGVVRLGAASFDTAAAVARSISLA